MHLETLDVDGPLHYRDHGGPTDGPVAVLVHGLGATHLSWRGLAAELTTTHRVLAPDLVGFGESEPLGRATTVGANARALATFLEALADRPVLLVGNSMGGLVSVLTTSRRPELVDRLVLLNGTMPASAAGLDLRAMDPRLVWTFVTYNLPLVSERIMRRRRGRMTPREQVEQLLAGVTADPSRVDPAFVDALVEGATRRRAYSWSDAAFLRAQRSIMRWMLVRPERFHEVLAGLATPTLLLHGDRDRLVPVTAARAVASRHEHLDLVELPGRGHAPQLEDPAGVAAAIRSWLGSTDAEGAGAEVS